MDGVPGVTQVSSLMIIWMWVLVAHSWLQYPIPPGGNFTYQFSVKDEYGFYWYHSHVKAYYNDGLRGPLFIQPSPSRPRPFEKLAHCPQEHEILLRAERDALSILLNDWTHDVSDTIYNRYFETGAFPNCVDSILANGFGRVECLPEYMLQAGPGLGLGDMDQTSSTMPMAKRMEREMSMDKSTTSQTSTGSMAMGTTMDMAMHTSSSCPQCRRPLHRPQVECQCQPRWTCRACHRPWNHWVLAAACRRWCLSQALMPARSHLRLVPIRLRPCSVSLRITPMVGSRLI